MKSLLSGRKIIPVALYCLADLFAVAMGMGVPIFAILLGFIVGWRIPKSFISENIDARGLLRKCTGMALIDSLFTFLVMLSLWGPSTRLLLNPNSDYVNFGIPMILYQPKASFVGWILLMIVISPFLQMLTILFSSVIRIIFMKTPDPSNG